MSHGLGLVWGMMRGMSPSDVDTRNGFGERLRTSYPVALLRAGHPKVALATTAVVTPAAALSDRSTGDVGLVAAAVLVGQLLLGWHNDVVDRERDQAHDRDKPSVEGSLDAGDLWFAIAVGVLAVIPLSIANGTIAGLSHLGLLLLGLLGNAGLLRTSVLSPLPWAASFGLWPAFLSYGGSGGGWDGAPGTAPPTIAITVLAALLGVGVHVLLALPGLVDDNADGRRHLPLRIALKTGASRLLRVTGIYLVAVVAGLIAVAGSVGLKQ